MNKKEEALLQNFPKYNDNLKQQLKSDNEYAQMWLDHLHNIDMLKDGIGLRAYGQKDPLIVQAFYLSYL